MIGRIVAGFVVIMVGVALLPEFSNMVKSPCHYEPEKKEDKPHRQTYLEYFRERRMIEKGGW
jgi:hypothetical protein